MSGTLVMTLYSDGAAPKRAAGRPAVRGRYDNAVTHDENKRNWWGADYLSAKSANSFAVRRQLRIRSRYEVSNNPYLFGIVNNNADDLIGDGPTLKVTTADAAYNRDVESAWREWWQEVDGVGKLRTQKLAKSIDGEGFLCLKTAPDLEQPVKLYPCDVEADQVTTPAPASLTEMWVDGLTLHPVTGRPTSYHLLRSHPGDYFFPNMNPLAVDKVDARHVLHWFGKWRPGQVRGVPVFTSSLDLFAELRAFRRAVLKGAEIAADFAAVIQQPQATGAFAEDDDDQPFEAFKSVPVDRGLMTMLPPGATMNQFDPKQPTTSYEQFQEKCLGEAVRPLNYPLNLALGTSQKFNFSSSKLDINNYRSSLRIERGDCERASLNRMFREFYREAVLAGAIRAYRGQLDAAPPREWHWPGFESIDPGVDDRADIERLAGGTDTYRAFWARRGFDWKDVVAQQAEEKKELARLGLEFGMPPTKTVTEDGDPPAPGKKTPPGAAAGRRPPIRAFDEAKVKRDEGGKFSETGHTGDGAKALEARGKHLFAKVAKYGQKAVAAAKAIKAKAYEAAVKATWAVQSAGVHADDIADTAHDYSKLINAKGTGDWLSTHLGVSGNTAAVVGSHVLAYGFVQLKKQIAKMRAKTGKAAGRPGVAAAAKPLTVARRAKYAAELLRALLPAVGCPTADLPTDAEVRAWAEKHTDKPKAKGTSRVA